MSQMMRRIAVITLLFASLACREKVKQYGIERQLHLPGQRVQVWAIAPAVNLSGISAVDPLLQADLVYQQLQAVHGVKVIPVNRVVEVYASLQITQAQSQEQAALVCDLLAADGLIVPAVTAYDPYNPPKLGASLQLFRRSGGYARPEGLDPRELARMASPGPTESLPSSPDLLQVVGMYDAANGSVREKLASYADGRNDPVGPLGPKEYLVSMDRFCGFAYSDLIERLMLKMQTEQ